MKTPQTKNHPRILAGLLVLLWCIGGTRPASAHGIDRLLRAEDQALGDYRLTVWTSPSHLRPGEVHVDVQVTQADGTPITAHFVQVQITPLDSAGTPQQSVARPLQLTNMDRNPATYETRFQLEEAGNYEVSVSVTGEDGFLGGATFAVEVTPISWVIKTILHGLLLASTLATLWLARMGMTIWLPPAWVSKS